MKTAINWIFFGNIFYGICAVALAVEANVQLGMQVNEVGFYVLIFCVTVAYYLFAIIREQPLQEEQNVRMIWFSDNRKHIHLFLFFLLILILFICLFFIKNNWHSLYHLSYTNWMLLSIFPLAGIFYYGLAVSTFYSFRLRYIGWLKPFIIGFCWSGLTVVFPVFYYCIKDERLFHFSPLAVGLFINNFMYITMLSILFDIKDYANDANSLLKTFVVINGLRKTIFMIVLPLSIFNLASFTTFEFLHQFKWESMLINFIPFIALIVVTWSMLKRKNIFYYLVIIDGMMLLKALCGTLAAIYF